MPSKHALNVSLTEHLCDFVASQVASGRFGTSSEVVRAALRLLERDLNVAGSFDQMGGAKVAPTVSVAASKGKSRTSRQVDRSP
jgi:putative addiction module CopG family antidote